MTDPFERAIDVFSDLCDLAPEEQARRLDTIGEKDPELRREVEEILLGDRTPDERLERRAEDFVAWDPALFTSHEEDAVPADVLESLTDRGRSLVHFREGKEVGRGGMGAVYQVWDKDLERGLAMKTLGTGGTPADSVGRRRLQRFLDEARITSQLDHPGIVPVHDLGIDSRGRAYFTMKHVRGRTLREIFDLVRKEEEGWTQTRALGALLRACEAMSYAHAKGVVHRDLKPANIMVGRFGEVYVMDWGVARLRTRRDERDLRPKRPAREASPTGEIEMGSPVVTMDGTVVGTPYFMSPEQARGGWVDERSDVYAIGALLFTLVAGRPPYGGEPEESTPYEVLERVIEGPPPPAPKLREAAPELDAICQKAMARAAEERYHDVSELAEDLRAYLEGRVVSAHRTGAFAELRKWTRRNRALAFSIALGIAVLAAGLVNSLRLTELAEARRGTAEANAAEAVLERSNALRLGSLMTADYALKQELDELWPAHPENLEAYVSWLATVEEIVTLYPEVTDELAAIRARALPPTAAERERDRQAHPDFRTLAAVETQLATARETTAVRAGAATPSLFVLDIDALPRDLDALNDRAWKLVDPDRVAFGREAEGLALARFAIDLALEGVRVPVDLRDTLAWALFANGLDDEALFESRLVLAEVELERAAPFEASLGRLEAAIEAARDGTSLANLEARWTELDERVSERQTWTFADPDDQRWHDVLTYFAVTFESLIDRDADSDGITPENGWTIERRKAWAERVDELTVTGPDVARGWRQAIASIADPAECPAYRGLEIVPQIGLVPIGRNPLTGLWEFGHPQTGDLPTRTADGRLEIHETTGLVFVLLPGGTFAMGAQGTRPEQPNYDPAARPSEGPVHDVALSPFFLSKYEMTQAQWMRMKGSNPSFYSAAYQDGRMGTTLAHPVEAVDWDVASKVCRWLGLALPSEAQWEYAARGGTSSVWWTGDGRDSLLDVVNLADQSARRIGAPWLEIDDWPELDDGHAVHAPVDSYTSNPFGLNNVHGNVWEWCADAYDPEFYQAGRATDPLNGGLGGENRVSRGGSFRSRSYAARVAYRQSNAPDTALSEVGLRPARALDVDLD